VVASCTPCDASVTVSRSGHLVALMRLRNSVSSVSGTFTWNGRMAVLSEACSLPNCVALAWDIASCSLEGDLNCQPQLTFLNLCRIYESRNHEMEGFLSNQFSWQRHTLFVV